MAGHNLDWCDLCGCGTGHVSNCAALTCGHGHGRIAGMTPTLPTDTYYRGYRLSQVKVEGEVTMTHLYYQAEYIDSTEGGFHAAKALVDSWLNAR